MSGPRGKYMIGKTPFEKFESKYIPVPESGCWIWTGTADNKGYGRLFVGKKLMFAHRFSYQVYKGKIPDGLELDHLCRVHFCVNPNHLEAVTHQVNLLRGARKTNIPKLTHCIAGHEFTHTNTISHLHKGRLHRKCRTCENRRQRERYARQSPHQSG